MVQETRKGEKTMPLIFKIFIICLLMWGFFSALAYHHKVTETQTEPQTVYLNNQEWKILERNN